MRAHELLYELKGADLPELEKLSSSGRKDAVIKRVKDLQDGNNADMDLLNEILQALVQGDLYDNLQAAGQEDADIAKNLERLTRLILYTKGSIHEKYKFTKDLQNSNRKYIDIAKLKAANTPIKLMDIVSGGTFVKNIFKELLMMAPAQGIGPGELALSILSTDILGGGSSSDIRGDLLVGGDHVEVKAIKKSAGRWADPRKAKHNTTEMDKIINKLLLETGAEKVKSGMKLKIFMETVNKLEDEDSKKLYFYEIFKLHINKLPDNNQVAKKLTKLALTGDFKATLKEYTIATYNNYKHYSNFQSMLLLDMGRNNPENWTLLYFEHIESAIGSIALDNPYMNGSAQNIGLRPRIAK